MKKALLAEAKAPRDVRRRQIRYGTGHMHSDLPNASEISKARKAIFDKGQLFLDFVSKVSFTWCLRVVFCAFNP